MGSMVIKVETFSAVLYDVCYVVCYYSGQALCTGFVHVHGGNQSVGSCEGESVCCIVLYTVVVFVSFVLFP